MTIWVCKGMRDAPDRCKNCTEEKEKEDVIMRHTMLAKAHQNDKTENVSRSTTGRG
jgi:hypothetical protein